MFEDFLKEIELEKNFQWRTEGLKECDGIITGCDRGIQWMFPWWFHCLRKHCDLPVTFIDYGMTESGYNWCKNRGEIIRIKIPVKAMKKRFSMPARFMKVLKRKQDILILQTKRLAWFKKPFALLQTPFKRTVWLDVDCEVRGCISPLFLLADEEIGLSLSPENKIVEKRRDGILKADQLEYNSGVISYKRGMDIIEKWAKATILQDGIFYGDQDILSRLIGDHKTSVSILSREYNWRVHHWGENANAIIQHWQGKTKRTIFERIKHDSVLNQLIGEFKYRL